MEEGEVERLKKLLNELNQEYYENCDGFGWDFDRRMQDYCKWICEEIERLEKRIKMLESYSDKTLEESRDIS